MRILFGCAVLLLAVPAVAQAPVDVKKAEAAVKAYVLDNVGDPDSVKWVKLGPHDLEGKIGLATNNYGDLGLPFVLPPDLEHLGTDYLAVATMLGKVKGPLPLIRARYRLANKTGGKELHDTVFTLAEGKVIPLGKNRFGDDWRDHVARAIKKTGKQGI